MQTSERLESGKALINDLIVESITPESNRLDLWVTAEHLKQAVQTLVENEWGYLVTITGKDLPPVVDEEGNQSGVGMIAGLYHFAQEDAILSICVKVPYTDAKLDTICDLIPSATIYEREFMELFGVDLLGTPDREKLVLPDDWPDGVYPLRKEFQGLSMDQKLGKGQ